jgi:hypothetical protein
MILTHTQFLEQFLGRRSAVIDELPVLHLKHPRYGYLRITIKLREKGWFINFKRVYRLRTSCINPLRINCEVCLGIVSGQIILKYLIYEADSKWIFISRGR